MFNIENIDLIFNMTSFARIKQGNPTISELMHLKTLTANVANYGDIK